MSSSKNPPTWIRDNTHAENTGPVFGDPSIANPAQAGGRFAGMDSRQRLTTSLSGSAPFQQLTPDQRYFRDTAAAGRWQADFDTGAHAPVNQMKRHDDGTMDLTSLEPDLSVYLDLGGKGGVDTAAGRP